jgi:competence protein ComEA
VGTEPGAAVTGGEVVPIDASWRTWLGVGVLAAAVVGGWLWFGLDRPQPAPLVSQVAGEAATSGSITVHVAGAVETPGLVEVASQARVADAVAAAGGVTRSADLTGLNLAAPLRDGEQIVVPSLDQVAATASGGAVDDGKVRINQATPTELEQLPGVGPVLAGRIYAYREEHGPFATVDDLLDVPGIGEGKLAALRDVAVVP